MNRLHALLKRHTIFAIARREDLKTTLCVMDRELAQQLVCKAYIKKEAEIDALRD